MGDSCMGKKADKLYTQAATAVALTLVSVSTAVVALKAIQKVQRWTEGKTNKVEFRQV